MLGPLCEGFQIFGNMFWCQQFTMSLLGDALLFCFCFLSGCNVLLICFPLVLHLSLEVLFWLRCGRFEILGLVVATVTFAPPSLGDALNVCFCFLFGLKVFEINFILIPHSPPERFYLTLL